MNNARSESRNSLGTDSSISSSRRTGSLGRGDSVQVKTVNFIIIGPPSVGKTSLLGRFVDRRLPPNPVATLGCDFKSRDVETQGQRVRLTIWDTAGQDHRRLLADGFYRRAQGVMLCYDVTDPESLASLGDFVGEMRSKCPLGHVAVLVGNKIDLESERKVTLHDAEMFQRKHGLQFAYETSAKDGRHVDETFLALTDHCLFTMSTAKRLRKNDKCELCTSEKATRLCTVCHQVFCEECQTQPHDPVDPGNVHRASELITEDTFDMDGVPRGSVVLGGGAGGGGGSRFADTSSQRTGGGRSAPKKNQKKGCPCK